MIIRKFYSVTLLSGMLFLSVLFISPMLHANWTAINDLVAEQQYNAAGKQIDRRLAQAKAARNSVEWTRALVERTKLYFEQRQYEAAAQFLSDQPGPGDAKSQVILSMYHADALSKYIGQNSWLINDREAVTAQGKIPVDKMTMAQLVAVADQAYLKAWQRRAHWRDVDTEQFPHYFNIGDYPARIRGSFLDTLVYLWVGFLADERHWTAAQSNKKSVLKAGQLLNVVGKQAGVFANRNAHPLLRISALLNNLARQHQQQNRREAALEAQRIQIVTLHQHVSATSEKYTLRQALRQRIKAGYALPWSTMLQWSLARYEQVVERPDALIQTKAVLTPCAARHQGSEGNKRCRNFLAEIMQPSFNLEAMAADGAGQRSLLVHHTNVDKLYLRAWRMDVTAFLESKEGNYRGDWLESFLARNKTDAEWVIDLPATRNYVSHKTFIIPPMRDSGMWLIAASDDATFAKDKAIITSVFMNMSSMVADAKVLDDTLLVTAYRGSSGQFIPRASVELRSGNKVVARTTTDQRGRAQLKISSNHSYSILVASDADSTLVENINNYRYGRNNDQNSNKVERSLVFTDRSIYRSGQKLQWKVMAYQGDAGKSDFRVMAGQKGWVKLLDAHGTEVIRQTLTTNGFGSAAGDFILKTGVPLGNWHLETSWGMTKYIKVEEYKRPTFEVKFNDATQALYLNRKVSLSAKAQYLFGAPVTDAEVSWRIMRSRDYGHYPYWRRPYDYIGPDMVASGTAKPDMNGLISIGFVPKSAAGSSGDSVDEAVVYRFNIEVDVTDSGGETRSSERSWRIGDTAIKAGIELPTGFVTAGKPSELIFSRSDLNDVPRTGQARWALYRIKQPGVTVLPADMPVTIAKDKLPYATAGDKLRPRWEQLGGDSLSLPWMRQGTGYDVGVALRLLPDGQAINRGVVRHDTQGKAALTLKSLPAGLYRLRYETRDAQGKVFKTQQELIVAAAQTNTLRVPLTLQLKQRSVEVGKNVEMLVGSGFSDMPVVVDIYQGDKLLRSNFISGDVRQINFPVNKTHRGGLSVKVSGVRDFQHFTMSRDVAIPWTDRKLDVSFSTFRDRLKPGQKETWRVTVKDLYGRPLPKGAAEIVAGMYDKSLDFFAAHGVFDIASMYSDKEGGHGSGTHVHSQGNRSGREFSKRRPVQAIAGLGANQLAEFFNQLTHDHSAKPGCMAAISHMHRGGSQSHQHAVPCGPGTHSHPAIPGCADATIHNHRSTGEHQHNYSCKRAAMRRMPAPKPAPKKIAARPVASSADVSNLESVTKPVAQPDPTTIRTNFNETAFFYPNLILGDNGSVIFEFEVPESLTEWKVWATALTRDLRGGSAVETTRTSKDLMVRPYLPRFLREGDQAEIAVMINNTSEQNLSGQLSFDIIDPDSKQSRAAEFKLSSAKRNFQLKAGASVTLRYPISTPKNPGLIAIRTQATAGNLSDGELRPLAILPSRMHLMESQFAVVNGAEPETLALPNLAKNNDPTRQHEKLVVNVEGQLFYSVLNALPYLVEYPYECTEQTLNRYLSTSIVKSVFDRNPAIASMAKQLAARDTRLEQWDKPDANRSLLLEETPWLSQAQGGKQSTRRLFNILNNQVAAQQRKDALDKLRKAQTEKGGFPWWAGGPESPTITLYQLEGFARALEFGQGAPKDMVLKAWQYLHDTYKDQTLKVGTLREITMLSYLLTAYPDRSWVGSHFNGQAQARMLSFAFQNRDKLSHQLKLYLALALHRNNRKAEADRLLATIMDGAMSDKRLGTYWKPAGNAWIWYYDNTVAHALTLRALTEMRPNDPRISGMVQWLLLDKKMNHWKSTRATAESIYALVYYLRKENQFFRPETATVQVGPQRKQTLNFRPDVYNAEQQVVVQGADITPAMQNITVSKQGVNKLPMFASATWHYSTDKIPEQAQGDFLQVNRSFFKRVLQEGNWTLQPLKTGTALKVGDQVEVKLTVNSKHNAEYIHLRSPRGAGFEPMEQLSGYKWQNGVGYYAEIRDSGANYFFERLPKGERELRYRLRATTAGQFRIAPVTLQSIYAPEFTAYSRGMRVGIR